MKSHEIEKARVLRVEEIALALRNSFRYTKQWLPTTIRESKGVFLCPNDDKILAHNRWNCKHHVVFTPKYRKKQCIEN